MYAFILHRLTLIFFYAASFSQLVGVFATYFILLFQVGSDEQQYNSIIKLLSKVVNQTSSN